MNGDDDNRPPESNRVWEKIGNHDGRLTTLEAAKFQHEHLAINLRAEIVSGDARVEKKVDDNSNSIHALLLIMTKQIERLNKFQVTIIVGGTVVACMVGGILALVGWSVSNIENIRALFPK